MTRRDRAAAVLADFQAQAWRDGYEEGLAVAERICAWLGRLPDTRRQAETREWAQAAIAKARERTAP